MQMAVIEFARNVLNLAGANSTEIDGKTKYPVVHVMEKQAEYLVKRQYGGTIRLGEWPCVLKKKTKLEAAYEKYGKMGSAAWRKDRNGKKEPNFSVVHERHRHRYEFNNNFKVKFEKGGMVFSGASPDGELVEAIEIPNHPFFLGTQFHPEYISRPLAPHPVFCAFVMAIGG